MEKMNFNAKRKEVTKILVDSFWYDPGFTTLYKSSKDITFFNTVNNANAQKYLAGELYFSCRNGNYYHYGEYSLEKEKIGLTLYKWNLYYVIR